MSPTAGEVRSFVRLVFLCAMWYAMSSSNGVLGKWILSEFPFPMTVTMFQLSSIALCSGPMLTALGVRRHSPPLGWRIYLVTIAPLSFAKFASSVMTHVSIWKVPVSYTHTVKATMPMFTVAFSRVLLGERHSRRVYLSLFPILAGVAVATVTEASFDLVGMASALSATAGFSLMNIYSKKALGDTGMHHLVLLYVLGRISCLMFVPFWLVLEAVPAMEAIADRNSMSGNVLLLLVADGLTHWLANILAFTVLGAVAPLTYAVCNVTKRISIIAVSIVLIGNHVTASNFFGMALAVSGVFCYNKVKYEENRAKAELPTTVAKTKAPLLWSSNSIPDAVGGVKLSKVPISNGYGHHHHHRYPR